jgi:uncharacterized protein YkwD
VPTAANLALVARATICLVNRERRGAGVGSLSESARLDLAAGHHSQDMVAGEYFDHVSPGGETMMQRIQATGYVPEGMGFALGENLGAAAPGVASPAEMVADWVGNAEHAANMLRPDFTETGVGVSTGAGSIVRGGAAGGAVVYTEEFGRVDRAA